MIELLVLFSSVLILGLVLVAKELSAKFRERQRGRHMDGMVRELTGQGVERALLRLGEPFEVERASAGQSLYVWKGPESAEIPQAAALLIVTMTVDAAGIVTKAAWETR